MHSVQLQREARKVGLAANVIRVRLNKSCFTHSRTNLFFHFLFFFLISHVFSFCLSQDAGKTQIASGSRTVLAVGPGG